VAPIAVIAGLLVASWALFWSTTRFGLPGGATLDAARAAITEARERFREVYAPTPPIPGFQLIAGLALWGAVWFADWAAFRLRATVEAVAPATVVFVFCTMLGSGAHRLVTAAAFAGAVLVFVSTHRAFRAEVDQAWLTSSPTLGPRAVLRAGLALAAVAVLGGALVGPHLPGADEDAVVNWRQTRDEAQDRTAVSPIVDLRPRLVTQSDTPFFQVRSDRPAYWRLTGLDTFDGQIWSIKKDFSNVSGTLTSDMPPGQTGQDLKQTFTIQNLDDIWVPAAFEARSIDTSSVTLGWEPSSSTLIVGDRDRQVSNTTYQLVSVIPSFTADQLRAANAKPSAEMNPFLGLPAGVPSVVADTARLVTGEASTRYDQMLALQNWFRSDFTYSTDISNGHDENAIKRFLTTRTGYCEQFAGTFAAMARTLGVPARVAVGFTPGESVSGDPTLRQVRGRHAHAWPEVWFEGVGWVPFEPTPGRGMPGAEAYTGVRPAQDETPASGDGSTTTSSTVPGTATTRPGAVTTTTAPRPNTDVSAGAAAPGGGGGGPSPWLLVAAVPAGVVLWALLVAGVGRWRRRRDGGATHVVLAAWDDVLRPLRWVTGLRPAPAETHLEFAHRSAPDLGSDAPAFGELAELATAAAWAGDGTGGSGAARAEAIAGDLRGHLLATEPRWRRWLRALSLKEAWAG
jgi:transglutaminase-like putative cysteine protease